MSRTPSGTSGTPVPVYAPGMIVHLASNPERPLTVAVVLPDTLAVPNPPYMASQIAGQWLVCYDAAASGINVHLVPACVCVRAPRRASGL